MTSQTTRMRLQESLDFMFSPAGQRHGKPTITSLAKIAGVVPKTVYMYPDVVEDFRRRRAGQSTPHSVDWAAECKRRSALFEDEIRRKKGQISQAEFERDAAYQRIQILELRLLEAEKQRAAAIMEMNKALNVRSIH